MVIPLLKKIEYNEKKNQCVYERLMQVRCSVSTGTHHLRLSCLIFAFRRMKHFHVYVQKIHLQNTL